MRFQYGSSQGVFAPNGSVLAVGERTSVAKEKRMRIGDGLRKAREDAGLSAREAARRLGWSPVAVTKRESEEVALKADEAVAMSLLYGCGLSTLLGLTEEADQSVGDPVQPGTAGPAAPPERAQLLKMLQDAISVSRIQAEANKAQAAANESTAKAAERAASAAERLAAAVIPHTSGRQESDDDSSQGETTGTA